MTAAQPGRVGRSAPARLPRTRRSTTGRSRGRCPGAHCRAPTPARCAAGLATGHRRRQDRSRRQRLTCLLRRPSVRAVSRGDVTAPASLARSGCNGSAPGDSDEGQAERRRDRRGPIPQDRRCHFAPRHAGVHRYGLPRPGGAGRADRSEPLDLGRREGALSATVLRRGAVLFGTSACRGGNRGGHGCLRRELLLDPAWATVARQTPNSV